MAARRIEAEARTEKIRCRVTPSTRYALEAIERETGVNVPALLAAIGILHDRGDRMSSALLRSVLRVAPGTKHIPPPSPKEAA